MAGGNVPGIPGACATHNFTYLARGPCHNFNRSWNYACLSYHIPLFQVEVITYPCVKFGSGLANLCYHKEACKTGIYRALIHVDNYEIQLWHVWNNEFRSNDISNKTNTFGKRRPCCNETVWRGVLIWFMFFAAQRQEIRLMTLAQVQCKTMDGYGACTSEISFIFKFFKNQLGAKLFNHILQYLTTFHKYLKCSII